jgi:hypothetical protein
MNYSTVDNLNNTTTFFPGSPAQAAEIAYTKIALTFYNYCGTSQNFPNIPNVVLFRSQFTGNWWYSHSNKDNKIQ